MNIKKPLIAVIASLGLALSLPVAALAATSSNYDTPNGSTLVDGLNNSSKAVQLEATEPDETAGQNLLLKDLVGTPLSQLTELSTDFKVNQGDCNGGSPRFYTLLEDSDGNDVGHVVYYISYNQTCTGEVKPSGNVASPDATVETHGDLVDLNGATFAQVQEEYGNLTISEIGLVVDHVNSSTAGQVITFDNVVTNAGATKSFTYTFEPAPAKPTNKDQCKNGGWQAFTADYKNQGQCVSSVAKQQNAKNENTSVLQTVKNKVLSLF